MTDLRTARGTLHHPLHTLVSWPAVFAGVVVAIAIGAMLNTLGVALGAASFNPYQLDFSDTDEFTVAAGMWMAVANAIALFIGGAIASRAAKYQDHHRGALHGLTVWALAFVVAIIMASTALVGGATAASTAAADQAAEAVQRAPDLASDQAVGDMSLAPLDSTSPYVAPVTPPAPARVEQAADNTATAALWAFLAMLLGAIAAVFGGMYGRRGHAWERAVMGTDDHATVR